MRREGRQRGWVRVYDRELVDPEGKRRAVHVVEGQVVANGDFIRAPRKPTNQSKSGGRRTLGALARKAIVEEEMARVPPPAARYGYCDSRYEPAVQEEAQAHPPAAARLGGKTSCKGGRKFRQHKKNMCYVDGDEIDYIYNFES